MHIHVWFAHGAWKLGFWYLALQAVLRMDPCIRWGCWKINSWFYCLTEVLNSRWFCGARWQGCSRVVLQQVNQGRELKKKTQLRLPLGSMEPRAGEDLGRNIVHPPAFSKATWNCQFIKKRFFPGKGHTRNPLMTNPSILLAWLSRNSLAGLEPLLLSFKPVFFCWVPFSETFHILEDNNWVAGSYSSQSLFCVLPPLNSLWFLHIKNKWWWSKLNTVL